MIRGFDVLVVDMKCKDMQEGIEGFRWGVGSIVGK